MHLISVSQLEIYRNLDKCRYNLFIFYSQPAIEFKELCSTLFACILYFPLSLSSQPHASDVCECSFFLPNGLISYFILSKPLNLRCYSQYTFIYRIFHSITIQTFIYYFRKINNSAETREHFN